MFAMAMCVMRDVLEAQADFLAKYGGCEEALGIVTLMDKQGWTLPKTSSVYWRMEIASLRHELDKADGPDYSFVFDHLIDVCDGLDVPARLCQELFSSKLFLHILVERLAISFAGHDSELFKLESDVLCHAGGVHRICRMLESKHFADAGEPSVIGKFLRDFELMFEDDDPKARWDEIFAIHQLAYVAFRRDFKRVLWRIDDQVLGKTELEVMFAAKHSDRAEPPRKRICRAQLEQQFHGSASEWRALSTVHSIRLEQGTVRSEEVNTADSDARMHEPVSDAAVESSSSSSSREGDHSPDSTRIWSTRLPFAPASATSDASVSEIENDDSNGNEQPLQQPLSATNANTNDSSSSTVDNDLDNSSAESSSRSGAASEKSTRRPAAAARASPSRTQGRDDASPRVAAEEDTTPSAQAPPPSVQPESDHENEHEAEETAIRVRPKRKRWLQVEVDALVRGYKEFSSHPNVWVLIKNKFARELSQRSNIDIKDKYRNLVKYGKLPTQSSPAQD